MTTIIANVYTVVTLPGSILRTLQVLAQVTLTAMQRASRYFLSRYEQENTVGVRVLKARIND